MEFGSYAVQAAIYRLLISKSQYELGQTSKEEFEHELDLHKDIYDTFLEKLKVLDKVINHENGVKNDT